MNKKRNVNKKEENINIHNVAHKVAITGSIFLGIFVLFLVAGDFTSGAVYRSSGFRGGEFFDILDLYYQYSTFFDLGIFLAIFLGLGQSILGKHLEVGGKSVYVGLGIFLSIALLIWERQTGFSLLESFGPWAFFIIIILLSVFVFNILEQTTGSGLIAIGGAYIVFYLAYFGLLDQVTGFDLFLFNSNIPIDVLPWMNLMFLSSIGLILWGIIRKVGGN